LWFIRNLSSGTVRELDDTSIFKYKQVIVIRTDLKMTPGKTAAQASHAAVSAAEKTRKEHRNWWRSWMEEGQCKIIVRVDSEEDLLEIEKEAKSLGLPSAFISDAGLTEVAPGTATCLGIGPAPSTLVDRVTRKLPLL